MGYKTLAIIHGTDGQTYRVRKWNDRHATAVGEISRPGKIQVRDPDGGGWDNLSRWSVAKASGRLGNQSDKSVMQDALDRLDTAFSVEPERIVYDQCVAQAQIKPDGVTIDKL